MTDTAQVFISYAYKSMGKWASALSESFLRKGLHVADGAPAPGEDLRLHYSELISKSRLMVLLLEAGDERRPWISFETQMMLQTCWKDEDARIAVVAPAVGAIPSALRHQSFVQYFAHDDVQFYRWKNPSIVDAFTDVLVAGQPPESGGLLAPMSDEEFKSWRNRLVHVGSRSVLNDPAERNRIVAQLHYDLSSTPVGTAMSGTSLYAERLLERALVAAELGEAGLVAEYYERLQALATTHHNQAEDLRPRDSESDSLRLGVIAYEAGDYARAQDLLEEALDDSVIRYGPEHPSTIGTLNNLALTCSHLGEAARAETLFKVALDRSISALGALHPQTAGIAYNLGLLLQQHGDSENARRYLRIAADAYQAVRPEDSPELADVLSIIASLDHADDE